jgi:hypothetical protein
MTIYYLDAALGVDTNTGLGEGASLAWKTLGKAAATVAAGDTVYIKGSGNYGIEAVTLITNGSITLPIKWIGYTTVVTDGGRCTFDGGSSLYYMICTSRSYNLFYNWDCKNSSTTMWFGNTASMCGWINCLVHDNAGNGWDIDNTNLILGCQSYNNGSSGINMDNDATVLYNKIYGNAINQLETFTGSVIFGNLIYGIPDNATRYGIKTSTASMVAHNTVDGEGSTINMAVEQATATSRFKCFNNIFIGAGYGVKATTGIYPVEAIGYNLFYNVNTHYQGVYNTMGGDITSDPKFTDQASDIYTLLASSPAAVNGLGLDTLVNPFAP